MKKRIFWKFFAGFFILSLLLAASFYFPTLGEVKSLYWQLQQDKLSTLADLLHAELTPLWQELDSSSLQHWIREKGKQTHTRLTLVDLRGKVLADSEKDPDRMQNHSDRPEIAAAIAGHAQAKFHFSFTLRENMMYFALPLKRDGETAAVLRLSLFVRDLEQVFSPWRRKITIVFLGLLFVSLFLSLMLSRNLTRPIRDLARAARRVASGDLDSHVRSGRQDEIGQLTADFNSMVGSQKNALERLQRSQQELETILSAISDGLLIIDARERISRAGPRFCKLIGDANPLGKPFWEVLRQSAFNELVKKASAGQTVHAEIEIDRHDFLVSLSPLPANGGTVVTFHDLSETRQLEKIKKDFIANVSHELRTPLTAIKGYAETLVEETTDNGRKYLDVIRRHTDRLIDLTSDLLTLSELEEKNLGLQKEVIDWQEMLAGIRTIFEKRLLEKKLTLDISLPEDLRQNSFSGDRFRLEQMFINLLENAVNYTEKGGIAVQLSTGSGRLRIEIKDSGVGIPAEHLPRLFERFYVANKARSRQTGGTGLGLAIVKHIVGLHDGEIEVQSTPGMGTVFIIVFPLPS